MTSHFDIAVVGGGLAGLTAAHHAAQGAASVGHIVGLELLGGLICNVGALSGFPSTTENASGIDLALGLVSSNSARGVVQIEDHAISLECDGSGFRIRLKEDEISASQVIAATGARLRMLNVPGAVELTGRGVSQCGWCDGSLQKGKDVVVVGGGDAAVEEALHLAQFARNLTIITHGDGFRARQSYVNKIAELENVDFRWMSDVVEIVGSDGVEAVRIINREEGDAAEKIDCSGVFVFVGLEPNSHLLADYGELDPLGGVVTDENMQTGTPGLFAVGAVRSGYRGRLVHAVGEAATAAMTAVARSVG